MKSDGIGGIYIILIDKYFYIGSTKSFKKRKHEHINMLKNSKHPNNKMQNVYNKHCCFDFHILERLEENELIEVEQDYLNFYFGLDRCLNLTKSADCPLRSLPKSESHRKALSVAGKGRKLSQETIDKIKASKTGYKTSDETKRKLSLLNKGERNYFYGKTGDKHPRYGEVISEETKRKIAVSKLGSLNPNFGKVLSKPVIVEYYNESKILLKTTQEVSAFLGVSDRTILRWLKNNPPINQRSIFHELGIKEMRNV